jgi:tetratricopeptide (TPR) repeat protein
MRLPYRVLVLPTVLSILSSAFPLDCLGQAAPKVQEPIGAHPSVGKEQPPFDKLELFGFFAAGPYNSYAGQVIRARGTDFTPDASFIASFPSPAFRQILQNIRARTVSTVSPDREAAYELLRRAWDAKQNRLLATANEGFQQALLLAPNSATLHLTYANNLLLSQDYPAAEAQARRSLTLWPENADAHASLALSLTAQKHFVEAESESREALRIFPEHHSALFALGLSLPHEQKYEEAIPVLQNAIATLPGIPVLRKLLGISFVETGKIDEGTTLLSAYEKNTPEDAEGHYYLGVALRLKGQSDDARSQFDEAFRLEPSNPLYEAAAHPVGTRSATDAVSRPRPEDGSVSGNVYTNNFFGFTYEFPTGWTSLSADAARAVLEIGGALISNGDPTETDVKVGAARRGYPLLYVVGGRLGNQPVSMKSVMVIAFNVGNMPELKLTPESFLNSLGDRLRHIEIPMEPSAAPEEITIAGRSFWRGDFTIKTEKGSVYESKYITADKGYLLMFFIDSPDLAGLHQVEQSLESIHFPQLKLTPSER